MRFLPIVLLLFGVMGCGSDSPSVDEGDNQAHEQDVENKSSPATSADESAETREQAIAAIKNLGGRINPDRPVIKVDFSKTKITDSDLEHLKGLPNLLSLNLDDTEISDTGLEHLKGMTELQTLGLDETQITDARLVHLTTHIARASNLAYRRD